MEWQRLPWKRRVLPLGEPPESDRYGWPVTSVFAGSSAGRPLADEREVPLLVLRGERGLGKSVALEQERAALEDAGSQVRWLDLGDCREVSLAAAKLDKAFQSSAVPGEWHVLLDGLDEGLDDLSVLDQLIAARVEALDEDVRLGLRLRISCRTARWPASLEGELRRFWPEHQVKIMGMAPLSREDVELAARRVGVEDAAAFTSVIQQRGLVALATHPVTLRQLLTSYLDRGSLPATTEQAYLDACLHLCAETRRSNNIQVLHSQTSPEHLLAVAARLAAALQFGPHTALSDAPDRFESLPTDLDLSRLAPGHEPGLLGGDVPCTLAELRRVTESSLLVPLGELRWAFAHQSYREFLAAHFLRTRGMEPEVQRELLWVGDGEARHVIPAHQEVAAWRSSSDATVFEDLLRDDPLVLLLADLPNRTDADRARTVEALLALLQHDDTVRLDHTLLHRLDHPQLAGQLRPHLQSATEVNQLYGAVSIARACRRPEITSELLILAEDTDLNTEVRVAALAGVADPDTEALQRIRALSQDASPEIAAAALRQLRPDHITLADFLGRVRDPDPLYIGTAFMLRREIPEQLGIADIADAALWARRTLWHPKASGSPALAIAVLARAVALGDQTPQADDLLATIGDALLGLAVDEDLLHSTDIRASLEDLGTALDAGLRTRRQLALYLFEHSSKEQFLTLLSGLPHGSFLPQADAPYWMENWDLLSVFDQDLARQAFRFPPPDEPTALAQAQAARAAHPALCEITAFWDNPPAEPPWERGRREQEEHARQQNTFNEADLRVALDAVLATPADQVRGAWTQVVSQLHRTADGTPAHPTGPLLTLADKAPSRPSAGTDLAHSLEQAALHLLRTVPPLNVDDLIPDGAVDFGTVPELTAFALVEDLSTLPPDPARWAGWAVALASAYDSSSRGVQRRVLPQCAQRAGSDLPELLTAVLDGVHDDALRVIANSFAALPERGAGPSLLVWAGHPDRRPEQWQTVLGELASTGDIEALNQVATALDADPGVHVSSAPECVRWMLAARTALYCEGLPARWPAIRRRLDNPATLKQYLEALARMPAPPGSWPTAVGQLTERDLADLYTLLVEHVGLDTLQAPRRSGFVRESNDTLSDMARSLPNILAAKNTPQAAAELRDLAQKYPDLWQLRMQARATARAAAARYAVPVQPEVLIRLAGDAQLRIVRDERQLLDIVTESLRALEQELQGYNGTAVNLWNRDQDKFGKDTKCWPCWEDDLCDAVTSFLRRDIGGHRVVVNREVEVRRTGLPGLRTDIQIEAPTPAGAQQGTIRVIIECKGCWNDDLPKATEKQLAAYLTEPHTGGMLLVGYFNCTRWNDKPRKCPKNNHGIEDIRRKQAMEAATLGQQAQVAVSSFVLDCRLPGEESDWRKRSPSPI
ncbi:hypothetical protein GCM10009760_61040 [Kitasatospora kazusensis]|uniref:HEAT repeat protein n=1 Tax=Kitasatospora kazusensis TaxID=407974 RepID=A0ABN3ABM5_9ACTN